ncbi:ABC transporter ATP-binding protein [Leucothrix pacifica]|uniref:ABC transporter ATP-binding protein n=1 Tax=Leucothrix pacifica TaxID=1247513 RepID=UPI0015E8483C|nr:ABC transporter ATP-binding protein [Leucothrix pacifica]
MSLIQCTNITKRYGSTLALDNVSLTLEAGAPIALIGPNGAGKTTLFSLLCGFLRASSGDALIMGHQAGSKALHGRLAALPQDANLDPRFSIGHQLELFAKLQGFIGSKAGNEVKRVLQQVDLSNTYDMKPEALSHGMRKRILLAQALMGSPELILLDEPTAGLDPPNVKVMRSLINDASKNATFIISSHNLDELEKVCQSVVHLDKGHLKGVVDIHQARNSGYLTVVMAELKTTDQDIRESLLSLPGVTAVSFNAPNRFVLEYDSKQHSNLDMLLMQHLSEKGWPYRQLVNGRTLEDQVYF